MPTCGRLGRQWYCRAGPRVFFFWDSSCGSSFHVLDLGYVIDGEGLEYGIGEETGMEGVAVVADERGEDDAGGVEGDQHGEVALEGEGLSV